MNLQDTIFILGAGASKPYGYPTASKLRDDIISEYENVIRETFKLMNRDSQLIKRALQEISPIIKEFDLSHTNSIDLFLTRKSERKNVNLGVELIWMFIMWYERNSISSRQIEDKDEDWYYEFFNELTGDITTKKELDNMPADKIHFINFNYDRSLENYLYESFMNSFSLTKEETTELMSKHFCFTHVYGKVANFDWDIGKANTIAYKDPNGVFILMNATNMINILYAERNIDPATQELIKSKIKIIVLGFGFAKANIDFLNLKEILTANHVIYATGIGLYESRTNKIKSLLQRGIVGIKDNNIIIEPKSNSLQLLRNRVF